MENKQKILFELSFERIKEKFDDVEETIIEGIIKLNSLLLMNIVIENSINNTIYGSCSIDEWRSFMIALYSSVMVELKRLPDKDGVIRVYLE